MKKCKCGRHWDDHLRFCGHCGKALDQKNIAELYWSLHMTCPKCKRFFDLTVKDDDQIFFNAIFNSRWEDLTGIDIECPQCKHKFVLDGVEY
jgi:phage FluMu protein Com